MNASMNDTHNLGEATLIATYELYEFEISQLGSWPTLFADGRTCLC